MEPQPHPETGESRRDDRQLARQRRRRIRLWVQGVKITLDACAFGVAWVTAWIVRENLDQIFGKELNPPEVYLKSIPLIILGGLLTAAAVGSYIPRQSRSPLGETRLVFKSALGSLLAVMSVGFLVKEFDYSRAVVVLFGVFSLLLLPVSRAIAAKFEERLVKLGILGTRVLIVGAGEIGLRALQRVQDHPEIGYRVVGFLDDDTEKIGATVGRTPVLGPVNQLRDFVLEERVDEVIIAMTRAPSEKLMSLVMQVDDLAMRVRVVADLFGVLSRETQIDVIEDVPVYDLEGVVDSALYRLSKRLFDLSIGIMAALLFVLTFPLISLAIKLESRGPALFVHDRVGHQGKTFRMWKYRTMQQDAGAYAIAPNEEGDDRVTRVGRLLRKTSLDELPQAINVLKGEMSIVGPRPEMPFIVEQYNDWQRKRLEVKPGITGLWQILGRKDLPLHENLEYDFYYIKNRSLLLDAVILFKTISTVLTGKGAY